MNESTAESVCLGLCRLLGAVSRTARLWVIPARVPANVAQAMSLGSLQRALGATEGGFVRNRFIEMDFTTLKPSHLKSLRAVRWL